MDRFDDPKSYRQKRESFTRSLQHFHETRGTPFKKIPQFCGKEVDLFRLYNVVTQRGGWVKVNRTNQWKDILHEFNIPKGCVNGGNALKQIYLRYLDRYEKVHYLGESGDRHDLDEEDIETRHRRWSTRSIHTVPLTYNHHQHVVVDNLRKFNGLSSDIYKPSDYDRLALSLVSPLPNEQDFAINVCTLLSNEGKHTLKLEKCPRIVDFLLAHAGVYNHSNLRVLFEEVYGQIRGHSLATFWSDVLETTDLLDLTDENNFVKKFPKRFKIYRSSGGRTFDGADSYFGEDQDGNSTHTRNTSPRKNDSRTVGEVSDVVVTVSETKDNDTANNRLTDSSENPNNSIQDSLKVGTGNNCNRDSCSVTNDDVCRNDEETSVKINTSVNSVKSNAIGSSDNVSGGENSGDSKWQGFVKPGDVRTTSNSVSSATKVQETGTPGEKVDGSESSTALTNLNVNESANLTEVKCEEDSSSSSVKIEAPDGSGVVEGDEGQAVAKIKTPEEIALEEEERRKEEERFREEKERLEAEEKARKEAEEKKRVEEERLRAIQEAKKLEKQLREAEVYEAMLREEENKKKRFFWEETPTRKTKSSEKGTLKVEPEDLELFCLGRENGTRDYIGQRVLQVAHILRNLTFCEESMHVMAKNTTFLRFLILCVNSKWSSLHQLGLDMLGNISPEITIEDPAVDRIFQAFFWTIHRGIQHTNRFFIISCLEILNKICQKDENEDVVCRNLDQSVYDQVCRLLSLHDIMILLYTLECLYSMSSMGEKACTYICRSKGAIEMLLALITVEAQSYGPKACILMRVIETVSGSAAANPPPPTSIPPPQAVTPNPTPVVPTLTACVAQPGTPQPAPPLAAVSTMTVQQATIPKIIAPTIMRTPSPKAMVGMPMAAVATPVQISATQCPPPLVQTMPTLPTISTIATMPTVQQQHAHQQTVQENEQFALAWLRATFELSVGGKVESQDLYKRYVESCNKMGRKGVIASIHFPRFVRSVFGGTVGPKSQPIPAADVKPGGPTTQSFYEGIKARDVPLTINIKLVPVTEVPRPGIKKRPPVSTPKSKAKRKKPETPTSPILKAQLISPSKPSSPSPSPSPSHTDGKVQVSTQTHPGPVSVGQSSSPPCTPPPMDNSTLIKSLLASKVSEICMTAPPGMLSDNTQVTQRQQQQKILQQQQLQGKVLETSVKAKVIRLNGIIQDSSGSSSEYQLATVVAKGKKEPPQPPTTTTTTTTGGNTNTVANLLRPKTPKIDGEDSDSMASTSRDCAAAGGGNVSSADDNDNSLTSFEGIFNGIPDSLDFDATVSTIVKENCAKKAECVSVITSDKNMKQKGSNEENFTSIQVANKSVGEDACVKQVDDKSMTEDSCVKQPQSKSLMLADLLDKKEGPALNGVLGKDLRIGEKGLELVEKAILKETHLNHKGITVKKDSVVSVNGDTRTGAERSTVIINATTMMGGASGAPQCGSKRSTEPDQEVIEEKRPKLDAEAGEDKGGKKGLAEKKVEVLKRKDEKEEVNGEEEVRASSTAANLFAALAAEALEDETDYEVPSEPQPQTVVVPGGQIRPLYLGESPPLIVTASGTRQIIMAPGQLSQQGQVLFSAGGQSLPVIVQNQRIVQGGSGQMLVASQPQQIIMSGNTQSQMLIAQPQTALVQGQPQTVLVAQTAQQQPGTKTIIILQPQSQGNANTQPQKVVMTAQGAQMVVATPVARQVVQAQSAPPLAATVPTSIVGTSSTTREDVVLTSGIQTNPPIPSLHQNGSQIQIISSGIQNNAPILNQNGADKNKTVQNGSAKTPATGSKTNENTVFICEWRGCMRSFRTANEVYMHVCNAHCPTNVDVETQCLWERCDGMKRKRFSLMTHLFDRHCNADALNMMAARRKQLSTQGRSEIPAPTPPPPHPGYAPNAAFHAIKRHALEFVNPKELLKANGAKACPPQQTITPPGALLLAKVASPPVQVKDDNEGPVTKSIRLTASLILRNLVIYSSVGRRFLKGYEPHLASIALSNVESSRTIAQVLADLNDSSSR